MEELFIRVIKTIDYMGYFDGQNASGSVIVSCEPSTKNLNH